MQVLPYLLRTAWLFCSYIHLLFIDFLFQTDAVVQKMQQNNVFTIAKRNVEGQDMLYQSLKLTNGIWVLNELKIQPGNPNITVSWQWYMHWLHGVDYYRMKKGKVKAYFLCA
jgi:hypothetical protein